MAPPPAAHDARSCATGSVSSSELSELSAAAMAAQENEENRRVSLRSVGSGDDGAKELGGGTPGTGRAKKSAKSCVFMALRV